MPAISNKVHRLLVDKPSECVCVAFDRLSYSLYKTQWWLWCVNVMLRCSLPSISYSISVCIVPQVERDGESNQQSDAHVALYSGSVISAICLSMWR